MPRKSAAALAVVTPITDHRPPPPGDLPEEQAAEWTAVVNRMPNSMVSARDARALESLRRARGDGSDVDEARRRVPALVAERRWWPGAL